MLAQMNSQPALIAYDRPSKLLMGFLAKHFNLQNHVQQNNNYVVFDDYYTTTNSSNLNETAAASPSAEVKQQQNTTGYDNSSVFGQSHMSSFQKSGRAPVNFSQHQTQSGGWGAPSAITQDSISSSQHMTGT